MACRYLGQLYFLCAVFSAISAAPSVYSTPNNDELSFMQRYGYLSAPADADVQPAYTPRSVADAVRKMQAFAGLPPTGVLDEETKQLFTRKRCGVKDIPSARRRRFVITQGWANKSISFRVMNGAKLLSQHQVEELMTAALAVWAPYGGLQFVRKDAGKADIEVSFTTGDHDDMTPFDGPGQALAHAFGPPTGAMHFDDDELWVGHMTSSEDDEDFYEMTDFFAVAVHEAGHALGLWHSEVPSSVMYPYYQGTVELDMDDIMAMHELYMKDDQSETTDSPLAAPYTRPGEGEGEGVGRGEEEDTPDICFSNYDAIQVIRGKIFVFEDEWLWVLNSRRVVAPGYPVRYHHLFAGLPARVALVRAVYEKSNGNVVIFSGREYWEFDTNFYLTYTGNLSDYHLPDTVTELTTVFLSNYNNKTYLISDEQFWRFDEAASKMDARYPKSMAAWRQLPYPIDAAIIWEGDTYFFQGPQFWRFDNARVAAHPYYPLPVARVWFPCEFRNDI
ncbi:hypothetical protein JYU34_007102 [Plutella xylostella]|uniref:Peptidase metallopeptidase domain-containing protein n=1 Tax=Plutella xylostella TaxID=51655 RepID=A0ABQ7QPL6_PLUXY|nr:hypothetical protein JYU34_007102 [Plutella xylostella]